MKQYTITYFGSRVAPIPAAGLPTVGPAGPQLFASRAAKPQRQIRWALLGSSGLHACVAVVFLSIIRPASSPDQPAAETIQLMFTPPQAAEPEAAPAIPDAPPEPDLPTQQLPPPPEVEPPRLEPPHTEEPTAPDPEPPPPVDPTPPRVQPPKPIPHPPPPKPAARPNPNSAASSSASAQAHATPIGPPSPPQTNEPPQAAISPGWQSAVGAWLQSNKTYPDAARRRGEEGRATVRFTVNREGRVIDFELLSSTGSGALDAAVDRLLRGARLPPLPSGMPQEQVTVTLQIRYTLER